MFKQRVLIAAALGAGVAGGLLFGVGVQEGAKDAPPAATRTAPVMRIATADVLGVVERMIMSDRYRPAQVAFTEEQNNKLKPLADELVALENRGATMPPNSPDLENLSKQFDQKRDDFQRARQEALAKIDAFNTDQVREAYKLTLQAVDDLAKQKGYTHVLASRTGPATIRSDNVAGALQEILARPVAKADPADDLTDELVKQFKLENVKIDEAPPRLGAPGGPQGPGPTPAPPAPKRP
jgi:hypothetical protein